MTNGRIRFMLFGEFVPKGVDKNLTDSIIILGQTEVSA